LRLFPHKKSFGILARANGTLSRAGVYTNPSNGIFTLQLERTDALTIRISDVSGRVIRSEQLSGSTLYSIDLQAAKVGVYVMEIETAEGRTFKQLIKN